MIGRHEVTYYISDHFTSSPIGGTINFEIIFYIVIAQIFKYGVHPINIYWAPSM